jgi:hypothetical protein
MHVNGIYENRFNLLKVCNSIAVYSLVFQLAARMIIRMMGRDYEIKLFHTQIYDFYRDQEKMPKHRAILNKNFDRITLMIKCYIAISWVLYQLPTVTCLITSILKREFVMPFEMFLPFISHDSLYMYAFNMTVQYVVSNLVWIFLVSMDCEMMFYSLMSAPMVDVFMSKIEIFAKRLEDFRENKEQQPANKELQPGPSRNSYTTAPIPIIVERKRAEMIETLEGELTDLIKYFETHHEYVSRVFRPNEFTVFAALSTNSISIGLSLLYLRLVSFPVGLTFTMVFFFQVFTPCLIGTIISIKNEQLLQAVCDFPWYELSVKRQKIFLQFIHQCQNAAEFKLPMVGDVNVELFTSVMNTSYSYIVFLLKFV